MDDALQRELTRISDDIAEIKGDVKQLQKAAPLHRIGSLEEWRRNVNRWLGALALSVIGTVLAVMAR